MNTLKLGTRCMSRDSLYGYATGPLPLPSCGSDAVRLVTVRASGMEHVELGPPDPQEYGYSAVPMCATCAEYHEKAGA